MRTRPQGLVATPEGVEAVRRCDEPQETHNRTKNLVKRLHKPAVTPTLWSVLSHTLQVLAL
jgi:hypothetical protein